MSREWQKSGSQIKQGFSVVQCFARGMRSQCCSWKASLHLSHWRYWARADDAIDSNLMDQSLWTSPHYLLLAPFVFNKTPFIVVVHTSLVAPYFQIFDYSPVYSFFGLNALLVSRFDPKQLRAYKPHLFYASIDYKLVSLLLKVYPFFLGNRYLPGYTQSVFSSGPCSVSVWGAISKDGLGPLVRIDGSFTATQYSGIITNTLLPYVLDGPFKDGYYIYQHDRSPVHTARQITALLEQHVVRQLQWPPCGADLNPIENVWGLMEQQLSRQCWGSQTAEELWEAIKAEWDALKASSGLVPALYSSMLWRVQQVIAVNGNFTSH